MYPPQLHSYLLGRSGMEPAPPLLATQRYTAAVSLIPATMCGIFVYGWYAGLVLFASLAAALLADKICRRFFFRDEKSFIKRDGVWLLTGLLVALMLPPTMPLWLAALGAFAGVVLGKYILQVDGMPLLQPSLLGLLALNLICPIVMALNMASPNASMNPRERWPVLERGTSLETPAEERFVPKFLINFFGGDIRNSIDRHKYSEDLLSNKAIAAEAVYGPRPLELVAAKPGRDLSVRQPPDSGGASVESYDWMRMLIGYLPSTIGGSGALGLFAGILLLLFSRALSPITPLTALATLALGLYLAAWIGGGQPDAAVARGNIPIHLLSGSTLLAVFYLASDPTAGPRSQLGKLYAGVLFGLFELFFRLVCKQPEGLLLSVLGVQGMSFVIDQWLAPPKLSAPSSLNIGLTPSSLGRL